ncbi:uncharacterized protein TNCV_3095871 [Trichonephila clavipes]|nr:uncharacterized protein TNCV_3095871 [Trichonephila clavipes]
MIVYSASTPQTDHQIGTSLHAPQRPMVTCIMMGTVVPGPHGNRGQNDDFSRGDQRNRDSSENFSRRSRRPIGRLNVLKVSDVKGDQTQSINEVPVKLSAICMPPVELPSVPILLNETFTKALWDTGEEKSFISEETYRKYFL